MKKQEDMKQCTKCGEEKELDEFYDAPKSGYKDGKMNHCKSCRKLYRQSRKDKDLELKKRNLSNPDKRMRKQFLEKERRKNKTVDYLYQQIKARAKRRNIEFSIEKDDIILPDKCPLLECEFVFGTKNNYLYTYSVDRINPKRGYIKGNIRVISSLANTMKNCASKEELLTFIKNLPQYLNDDIVRTTENNNQ